MTNRSESCDVGNGIEKEEIGSCDEIQKHEHISVPKARILAPESSPIEQLFHQLQHGATVDSVKAVVAEHGKEILKVRDAQGHTVTHWVAYTGNLELLIYVLKHGAPLNEPSQDSVQLHPIHWACTKGHLSLLHHFVSEGVNINQTDAVKNRSPLLLSAQYGFPLLVFYCLKNGADFNVLDCDGDSAIHWAAYKGLTDIVAVFHNLGLNTNEADNYNQTPLHLAAIQGHLATVEYLVDELDCELSILDSNDKLPIDLARSKYHHYVVNYLSRRMTQRKWNIFQWWEDSDKPFYFVLLNIGVVSWIYYYILLPLQPDALNLYIWHFVLNFFTWFFFVKTWRKNAGNIKGYQNYRLQYDKFAEQLALNQSENLDSFTTTIANLNNSLMYRPLCHSCQIQKPIRSKHCKICKCCIEEFDHHCPFVGNCIGKNNYGSFIGFVGFLCFNLFIMVVIFCRLWRNMGFSWWLCFGFIYYGILLIMVSNMFILHVYLTMKNLTTNELINKHRYSYLKQNDGTYNNPFDIGLIENVTGRLFPSTRAQDDTSSEGEYFASIV